ncbi:MAG: restriction endonuclease, partial [Mucilaginibacter sp.]|uniref:restriction endonuclease n=1 Tax=Mucilaginibacter sp. TaxID=1882438 RepID=UPI0031A2AE0F
LTRGQPEIVDYILRYVKNLSWSYSLAEVEQYIFEKIIFAGIRDNTGQIILPENPIFQEIKNDIIIVNGSALQWLKMRPENMYNLKPREFEEVMAELLEKRGYKVDLTQATRDGGKDLIIARHDDIGNFIYYVECKQYRQDRPVGVNLVRELAGTVDADKVTAGIMITSSYFSPDAVDFSNKSKHRLSLVDYIKLREWLAKI